MKSIKKIVLAAMIMIGSVSLVACGSDDSKGAGNSGEGGTVLAKVADEEVTQSELDKEMSYIMSLVTAQYGEDYASNPEIKSFVEQQKKMALDYLVDGELLYEKANLLKLEVTDEEIQKEYDGVKAGFQTEEEFNKALEAQNLNEETFKKDIQKSLMIQKVLEKELKEVTVSDEEIKAYYDKNIALYTKGPGANMYHILVKTEEEAKKVKEEYEAGATFSELAGKYGTDGTKSTGGSLGFVEYASQQYDQDFLAGAKALKEGEVSEPVKTQFGYHLIKVDGIKNESVVTPLDEVKEQIKTELMKQKENEEYTKYLDQLKKEIKVEKFEDKIK